MKYLREILLCVVLTAACSVATLHGGDSLSLKIMTYNLRFGEKASLEELAEAIPRAAARSGRSSGDRLPHPAAGVERQHDKDFVTELGLADRHGSRSTGKPYPMPEGGTESAY